MAGFHGYLCNALDKVINKEYQLKYNEYGLLNHTYEEVKKFTHLIEGQGEQVEWMPVKLEKHTL